MKTVLTLLFLATPALAVTAPGGAQLQLLTPPAGFSQGEAMDTSDDGQVIVGRVWPNYEAFRWTDSGGFQLLGVVPGVTTDSNARAVSGDGEVVVGWGSSPNVIEGFRWEAGSGMTHLPALGGLMSIQLSAPECVDRGGTWVGGYSYDQNLEEGTIWPAGGAPFSTGMFVSNQLSSVEAIALDAPLAVGYNTIAGWSSRATTYDSTNGLVDLGVLGAYTDSIATAVSHDGTRVIGSCHDGSDAQGFAWTAGGGMVPVGTWPAGISQLFARDCDGDGETFTGTYQTAGGVKVGFYYSPATGVVSLASHLAANGASLSGIARLEPEGMSGDGNVIVGTAVTVTGTRLPFRSSFAPVGGALLGSDVCAPSVVNSVGKTPDLEAFGSPAAVDNDCVLYADDLPPQQFALFIISAGTHIVPNFNGGVGTLCLAQPLGRLGTAQRIGASGTLQKTLDLNALPLGPTQPGTTWYFQLWYRDNAQVMNFTSAREVTFQ